MKEARLHYGIFKVHIQLNRHVIFGAQRGSRNLDPEIKSLML